MVKRERTKDGLRQKKPTTTTKLSKAPELSGQVDDEDHQVYPWTTLLVLHRQGEALRQSPGGGGQRKVNHFINSNTKCVVFLRSLCAHTWTANAFSFTRKSARLCWSRSSRSTSCGNNNNNNNNSQQHNSRENPPRRAAAAVLTEILNNQQ